MRHILGLLGAALVFACGSSSSSGDSPGAGGTDSGGASASGGTGGKGTAGAKANDAGASGEQGEGDAGGASENGGSSESDAGAAGAPDNTAGSAGTAGAGTVTKMDCDLAVTNASSNIGLTEFASGAGQGKTTMGHPNIQGIHAQTNTADAAISIDIVVAGDAPAVGLTYPIDPITPAAKTLAMFTIGGTTELKAWDALGGGIVSVSAVKPGSIPSYYDVTFKLDAMEFTPRSVATNNKATGNFKLTGLCKGAITK